MYVYEKSVGDFLCLSHRWALVIALHKDKHLVSPRSLYIEGCTNSGARVQYTQRGRLVPFLPMLSQIYQI